MEKAKGKAIADVHARPNEDCFENQLLKVLGNIDSNIQILINEVRDDKEMKKEARSTIDELQSKIENFKNNYHI